MVSAAPLTSTATSKTTWFNYSYVTSGFNLCNEATNICRTLGHWVFSSASAGLTDGMVTGASFSVDGGAYIPSKRGNFEAHFVNGQCSNTTDTSSCTFFDDKRNAQVWNIGYDLIQHGSASTLTLPSKVCAKVWTLVPATGQYGTLPEYCADFGTETFSIPGGGKLMSPDLMYSSSADAVSYLCDTTGCRADGHISVDVQVLDPTQELLGLTEYSIDGGKWTSAKTNTFFEQKVKHQDDKWYHTISWNYDDVFPKGTAAPEEICVRMAVQNQVTLVTWQMDFGEYAAKGSPNVRCLKFCKFTNAFSYATAAGGYCPPTPPQVE